MLRLQGVTLGIFLIQTQVILPEYQGPKSWEKFFPIPPIFCLLVPNLKDLVSYVFSILQVPTCTHYQVLKFYEHVSSFLSEQGLCSFPGLCCTLLWRQEQEVE